MHILGLNHGEYNSSAAIIRDGTVLAGAPEERFSRNKRTKQFPKSSIEYCLRKCDLELSELDAIAQAWNPGAHWTQFNPFISSNRVKREDYFYSVPDNLLNIGKRRVPSYTSMSFPNGYELPELFFVNHHQCHAANAFYSSPFENAAIFTADWRGETESAFFGVGKENLIEKLSSKQLPNSLGLFYATYTQLLGYKPDNDEWKVMALSAFEVDSRVEESLIRETVRFTEDGWFELDQSYYKGMIMDQPNLYTEKLFNLLQGSTKLKGEALTEWQYKIAKAMQTVAEDLAVHALKWIHNETKLNSIALGGGFFMNSVFNGKVTEKTPFTQIYVPFAPADVGNSIGSALYVSHAILGQERSYSRPSSYIGPSYSDSEILNSILRRKIPYSKLINPEKEIAQFVLKDQIIAYFDGQMEFGERALGNRSILADPRNKSIKDKINSIIKYRESYRPFAPVCIVEDASKYFQLTKHEEIQFMEKVIKIREQYKNSLAAVSHVDLSARLQTLSKSDNPRLYNILLEFEKYSGFPILLNTSFNINGEPIVCSPDDALNTFFNSGLETLVIGNYVINK